MTKIIIPKGRLNADTLTETQRKLKEKLLQSKPIQIGSDGKVNDTRRPSITVPPGKLAYGFQWYENDEKLLEAEIQVMNKNFPQFELDKLSDGRLYWFGKVKPQIVGNSEWWLQMVYDADYPQKRAGGSIKVYSIDPDLNELNSSAGGNLPSLIRDSRGKLYICAARAEDLKTEDVVTSAASTLGFAMKWIAALELYMAGQFNSLEEIDHKF